jgi:hypothetical protein
MTRTKSTGTRSTRRWFPWIAFLAVTLATAFAPASAKAQNYRSPLILSSYSVTFSDMQVGRVTSPQTVTVLNIGASPVRVTNITLTGDFAQSNDCPAPPATLATNDACNIQIVFKPSANQGSAGTLTVSHDSTGSPLTCALSGSGTLGGTDLKVSPGALNFPDRRVGTGGSAQEITVANQGARAVVLTNIAINGDFTIMPRSTCEHLDAGLAANTTCSIVVTFHPLGPGMREGEVSVTNNQGDQPQTVHLTGAGTEPQ